MKPGDFVDVHLEQGCVIGRLLSDEGETVTVSFGDEVLEGIPKELCTLWVSVQTNVGHFSAGQYADQPVLQSAT